MKTTTKLLHTQGTLYTFSEDAHFESWVEIYYGLFDVTRIYESGAWLITDGTINPLE
ncbi:MAG: hypothetical protein JSW42_14405 [Chloroflexota bacterium]|nr:MAG: hypothetical protein JSW42_14405 [Chloroflexota bacterium]